MRDDCIRTRLPFVAAPTFARRTIIIILRIRVGQKIQKNTRYEWYLSGARDCFFCFESLKLSSPTRKSLRLVTFRTSHNQICLPFPPRSHLWRDARATRGRGTRLPEVCAHKCFGDGRRAGNILLGCRLLPECSSCFRSVPRLRRQNTPIAS